MCVIEHECCRWLDVVVGGVCTKDTMVKKKLRKKRKVTFFVNTLCLTQSWSAFEISRWLSLLLTLHYSSTVVKVFQTEHIYCYHYLRIYIREWCICVSVLKSDSQNFKSNQITQKKKKKKTLNKERESLSVFIILRYFDYVRNWIRHKLFCGSMSLSIFFFHSKLIVLSEKVF